VDKYNICLIIPYFGRFPNYIDFVFRSFGLNKNINWLLFSDCKNYSYLPDNIKLIDMTFNEFKELMQANFKFRISLDEPYKICDFRPAFGFCLEKYINKFDFWGYCDIDLIMGDLESYLSDDLLFKYDKIFTRGHLTILKNHPTVNKIFMDTSVPGVHYKKVFSSEGQYNFDEMHGINLLFRHNKINQHSSIDIVADISSRSYRLELSEFIIKNRANYNKQIFYWKKGKVYQAYSKCGELKIDEYIYIHLQKRKFSCSTLNIKESSTVVFNPNHFCVIDRSIGKNDLDIFNKKQILNEIKFLGDKLNLKKKLFLNKRNMHFWE